jgi:hypothetical protein
MKEMADNNELERTWKYQVMTWHHHTIARRDSENHDKP